MAPEPVVLCVDDEAVNISLLEALLEPLDLTFLRAADGREALRLLDERQVDLVLLDVMMPGMDGFEVCRRIKERERTRPIPVVLLTALSGRDERIRGIDAGADDFITKPFDTGQVLARVRMLLKVRALDERLRSAYENIVGVLAVGGELIRAFDPLTFDFKKSVDAFASQIIRRGADEAEKAESAIVGLATPAGRWVWRGYGGGAGAVRREGQAPALPAGVLQGGDPRLVYFNAEDLADRASWLPQALAPSGLDVRNAVCYLSPEFCILLLNFGKTVTAYDAAVLDGLVTQSLFLRSLAQQVSETEDAFSYTVGALARAAEANDQDTGNHILRVGDYCAALSARMGLPEPFVRSIRLQAQMHDVGKIHIHPDLLRKQGDLTPEEWADMRKHTLYGAVILGDHPRLGMAKNVALSHHEKYDGSGYPFGLKGDEIPIEGLLVGLADQYDALRSPRFYKPSWDHDTTVRMITGGTGRTYPAQFAPVVLETFKAIHEEFAAIYDRLSR